MKTLGYTLAGAFLGSLIGKLLAEDEYSIFAFIVLDRYVTIGMITGGWLGFFMGIAADSAVAVAVAVAEEEEEEEETEADDGKC